MANSPQAKKRARQAQKRRLHNKDLRSKLSTYIKKVRHKITDGDKTAAQEAFKQLVPVLDRMAGKAMIHKNKAARYKSRLNAQLKAL